MDYRALRPFAVLVAVLSANSIGAAGLAAAEETMQPAHEQMHHADPKGDAASAKSKSGEPLSEASKAYEAAMQKMHASMSMGYTNDVDVDFVRGMIPHHQGAVAQAEVLLKYSKNPRLRRLAGGIIAAQKREIRFMENWLKEHAQGVETAEEPAWLKSAPSTVEDANVSGNKD